MTREEEMKLANKLLKNSLFGNYGEAFIAGVELADEHPKNIKNIWYDASEEPLKDSVNISSIF